MGGAAQQPQPQQAGMFSPYASPGMGFGAPMYGGFGGMANYNQPQLMPQAFMGGGGQPHQSAKGGQTPGGPQGMQSTPQMPQQGQPSAKGSPPGGTQLSTGGIGQMNPMMQLLQAMQGRPTGGGGPGGGLPTNYARNDALQQ